MRLRIRCLISGVFSRGAAPPVAALLTALLAPAHLEARLGGWAYACCVGWLWLGVGARQVA